MEIPEFPDISGIDTGVTLRPTPILLGVTLIVVWIILKKITNDWGVVKGLALTGGLVLLVGGLVGFENFFSVLAFALAAVGWFFALIGEVLLLAADQIASFRVTPR